MPRVVIVVDRPAAAGDAYRVEAPDRVLRMFGLLTAARDELDLTAATPEASARIQRMLDAVSAELERSVSPPLADELHDLTGSTGAALSTAELRIKYAGILGWASGLVVAMLDQLGSAIDQSQLRLALPQESRAADRAGAARAPGAGLADGWTRSDQSPARAGVMTLGPLAASGEL